MLSLLVVCYLFFGGLGAGVCFLLRILGLLSPASLITKSDRSFSPSKPYRAFFSPAFIMAFIALLIGVICLFADLGRIDRVAYLFMYPSLSYLTIGSFTLGLLLILVVVGIVFYSSNFQVRLWIVRIFGVCLVVVSSVVMVYTGLLLQSIYAVAFWATPFIPILFVLSSLSTGIASIVATACFTEVFEYFSSSLKRLLVCDMAIIMAEAVVMILFVVVAFTDSRMNESAIQLLKGDQAIIFWLGFVLCGLIVPFIIEAYMLNHGSANTLLVVFAVCVFVGGFILRLCIVNVGFHPEELLNLATNLDLSLEANPW